MLLRRKENWKLARKDGDSMQANDSKFKTKTGRLTLYSFACGYIERKRTRDDIETTMWMEHGTFEVRQYDHTKNERVFWQGFESLRQARNCFGRQKGRLVR